MHKISVLRLPFLAVILAAMMLPSQAVFAGCGLPTFAGARLFSGPPNPFFLATGDFNHDGNTDIAATNQNGNMLSILLSNGDGTFKPAINISLTNPAAVVVGDFNGDGNPDLAVWANYATVVMLGNGDGTFQNGIVTNSGGVAMAVGDFNNDGKLDLAVLGVPAAVMLGNGDGTFQKPPFTGSNFQASFALAAGDFNKDGKLDVVVALSGAVGIMLGDGKGNLADPVSYGTGTSGAAAMALSIGDFNGDGNADVLALSPLDSNVYEMLGNGDGTLQSSTALAVGNFSGLATSMQAGDFNGDGKLDFAVANQPSFTLHGVISVFYGNGDGTFQPEVQYNATGIVAAALGMGDFNGDGVPDLVFTNEVTTLPTEIGLLFGGSNGLFQTTNNYAVGPTPIHPAIGDFNGDGIPDLAVAGGGFSGNLEVLLGNGDGTYQAATYYPTAFGSSDVAAADFNGDGKMDLAVANGTGSNILMFLGNGDGTFQSPVSAASVFGGGPAYLAVGDFNKDGIPDLAVASGILGVGIYIGNGDGTFRSPGFSFAINPPQGQLVAADLNGDGNLDLAIANSTGNGLAFQNAGNVTVMLGNGDGTLRAGTSYTIGTKAVSVAAGDLNGDGHPDLAAVDFGSGNVNVLLGNGDGTFQKAVAYAAMPGANWVAMSDFDGDGNLDLAIASQGSTSTILGAVTMMMGKGDGTFQNALTYSAGADATSLAVGDLNVDGKPDLVFTDAVGNNLVVLLNSFIPGSSAAVCTAVPQAPPVTPANPF